MSNEKISIKKQVWFDLPTSQNPLMTIDIYEKARKGEVVIIDEDTGEKYEPILENDIWKLKKI